MEDRIRQLTRNRERHDGEERALQGGQGREEGAAASQKCPAKAIPAMKVTSSDVWPSCPHPGSRPEAAVSGGERGVKASPETEERPSLLASSAAMAAATVEAERPPLFPPLPVLVRPNSVVVGGSRKCLP